MITILIFFLLTFFISFVCVWFVRTIAHRFGWVVAPRVDRWHKKPVALFGGIGMFIAFWCGLSLFYGISGQPQHLHLLFGFFLGACTLFTLGLIDDIVHLKPSTKLIGQIIGVSIPVVTGFVFTATQWPIINSFITFFWFLGVINAINLIDNMDGLASGVVIIAIVTLLITFFVGDGLSIGDPLTPIAVIFLSIVAGFWIINRHPALIFMGDSGSLFLGYILAGITMPSHLNNFLGSSSSIFSLIVPALVLSVPLFDTAFVTIERIVHGISPAKGGRDHSSHRLVGFGFPEDRAVLLLYSLAALGGITAIALIRWPDFSIVFVLLYLIFLIFIGVYLSKKRIYSTPSIFETQIGWMPFARTVLYKRHAIEVLLDFIFIVVSYCLAYYLRFENTLRENLTFLTQSFPIVVASCISGFFLAGIYRGIWHFITLFDISRFFKGVLFGVGISLFSLTILYRFEGYSRAVFIIFGTFLFLLTVGSRLLFRFFDEIVRRNTNSTATKKVVIYGAGQAGKLLLDEWSRNARYAEYSVVGFIDDDPLKGGQTLGGISIYTQKEFICELSRRTFHIYEIWISSDKVKLLGVQEFLGQFKGDVPSIIRRFAFTIDAIKEQS